MKSKIIFFGSLLISVFINFEALAITHIIRTGIYGTYSKNCGYEVERSWSNELIITVINNPLDPIGCVQQGQVIYYKPIATSYRGDTEFYFRYENQTDTDCIITALPDGNFTQKCGTGDRVKYILQ